MPIVRFLMDREMWGQTGRSPISDCLKLGNHFGKKLGNVPSVPRFPLRASFSAHASPVGRAEYIALVCIRPAVEVLVVDIQKVIAEGLITEKMITVKMITVRVVTQRQPIRCGGWTS